MYRDIKKKLQDETQMRLVSKFIFVFTAQHGCSCSIAQHFFVARFFLQLTGPSDWVSLCCELYTVLRGDCLGVFIVGWWVGLAWWD